jgi:N-formylglutamate amidohydrolase
MSTTTTTTTTTFSPTMPWSSAPKMTSGHQTQSKSKTTKAQTVVKPYHRDVQGRFRSTSRTS